MNEAQRLNHRIMHGGTHLRNLVIPPRGIDAIGEQHNEKFAIRVNPDGSAGKSGVPKTMRREKVAAGATFGGHCPAERARTAGKLLRRRELSDGGAAKNALTGISSVVKIQSNRS